MCDIELLTTESITSEKLNSSDTTSTVEKRKMTVQKDGDVNKLDKTTKHNKTSSPHDQGLSNCPAVSDTTLEADNFIARGAVAFASTVNSERSVGLDQNEDESKGKTHRVVELLKKKKRMLKKMFGFMVSLDSPSANNQIQEDVTDTLKNWIFHKKLCQKLFLPKPVTKRKLHCKETPEHEKKRKDTTQKRKKNIDWSFLLSVKQLFNSKKSEAKYHGSAQKSLEKTVAPAKSTTSVKPPTGGKKEEKTPAKAKKIDKKVHETSDSKSENKSQSNVSVPKSPEKTETGAKPATAIEKPAMVLATIRLVGETEDGLFDIEELEPQISRKDLKNLIERLTRIRPHVQRIKFRGAYLLSVEHPITNIEFGEELEVMHSDLSWWELYMALTVRTLKPGGERLKDAMEAVMVHSRLMENGFFQVYQSFNRFRVENHHKIAAYTDGSIQLMREASSDHFLKQHMDRGAVDATDFVCRFENRPKSVGGSRKNTLAFVQLHGEKKETKYNIKCYHFGSSRSSPVGQPPDIKEIYCYKLLELMNVRPHSQFILTNILTGSYWNDTNEVAIVDFMPKSFHEIPTKEMIQKTFFRQQFSPYWELDHIKILETLDAETHKKAARECLTKWDLLSKIDLANEMITPEKNKIKEHEISFRGVSSPTKELDEYVRTIKQNIMRLLDFLNM